MRGLGTPEYAPPEQYGASTDHTGPPSDLYSLGATLYHALTGQSPPTATERMAVPDQFIPLRKLAPRVSPRTDAVVMKALELSVPMRWRTASEMEAGLRGSGELYMPSPSMPSPFVEASGYVPTQRVGTTAPSPSSQIPIQPSSLASTPVQSQRKKWPLALGIVGGLLCIISICIGGVLGWPVIQEMLATTSPQPITPVVSGPTNTVPPTPETFTGDFRLNINNLSPYDVCYVYISSVDNDSWGDDWLGEEQVIPSGGTFSFDVPEGSYDFLAETCDEATLHTGWNIQSDISYDIGGAGLIPVWLFNSLDEEICYVFISPVTSDDWGQDWLGDIESIPAGGVRILFVNPDTYDFSARNCDEQEIGYQYDITVNDATDWILE
jgi:serine/threonine protein kinase